MKHFVRLSLAALLVLPGIGCAQDRRQSQDRNPAPERQMDRDGVHGQSGDQKQSRGPRRLESVTWNSVNHQLIWVISKGEKKEGTSYTPLSNEQYEISMDKATMTFHGETRKFSKEEATNVHALMDLISKYAVDSTIWWDQGHGEPVDGSGKTSVAVSHSPEAVTLEGVQSKILDLEHQLSDLRKLERLLDGSAEETRPSAIRLIRH